MFRHLLIATDGSDLAGKAVEHGLGLAKSLCAEVTLLTVTEPIPATSRAMMPSAEDLKRFERGAGAAAVRLLDGLADRARSAGVSCATRHIAGFDPAESILSTCSELGCDGIVMATHGRRGLDRLLIGSQAAKVMAASPVPVLVCRG